MYVWIFILQTLYTSECDIFKTIKRYLHNINQPSTDKDYGFCIFVFLYFQPCSEKMETSPGSMGIK